MSEPSGQQRGEELEEFRRMLAETKETFRQTAAELKEEELIKPPPTEAVNLLRKAFGSVLDALAESKKSWHDLDARAGEAAELIHHREMKKIKARIGAGDDVDSEVESSRVTLAELEAGQEVVKKGASAISERFAQQYRADEMLQVSQRCHTAAYDRESFSRLYAEMHSRYQAIVAAPGPARSGRSQIRFVEDEEITESIVRHFDLAGAFSSIFEHACLKALQAFKFQALLEQDFIRKSYPVEDVAYILGIPSSRECPFCRANISRSAKLCGHCNRELLDADSAASELNREIAVRLDACKRGAQRLTEQLRQYGMSADSANGWQQAWMALKETSEKSRRPAPEDGVPPPIAQPPVISLRDNRGVPSVAADRQAARRSETPKPGTAVATPDRSRPMGCLKGILVWTCRIVGSLGMLGGIGLIFNPEANKRTNPNDPVEAVALIFAYIIFFSIFGGMTAFGFWPRKNRRVESRAPGNKQSPPPAIPKVSRGSSPPPILLAPSIGSQIVASDDAADENALFLARTVRDKPLLARCQAVLDAWSSRIPFSPIKKLGSKAELVSATEIATYKTTVTSQLEKRWLEDHEVPYRGQSLPAKCRSRSEYDPWKLEFPRCADFRQEHHSIDFPDTRRVYDCSHCHATGRVTCSSCAGRREVQCYSCSGYGFKECSSCSGRGHERRTRKVSRQVKCFRCSGRGYYWDVNHDERCYSCGGRGTELKEEDEEYYVPCGSCAASGKIPCSTCRSRGMVTCSTCGGSAEVTCPDCQGQRQLMAYVSAEQTEEPATHNHQYVPQGLPSFRRQDNPLTKLGGTPVFSQDEAGTIKTFEFAGDPAASVLSGEVEACRQSHQGHVVRQRVTVERCSLVEYRYRHSGKTYSIFLNPNHELVEDLGGPIQDAIENMDSLAQKAFGEKRYEDAYRLNLRALCMDEATKEEKDLRKWILKRLTADYRKTALLIWLVCTVLWLLIGAVLPKPRFNLGPLLALPLLLVGVRLFARDTALRFGSRSSRRVAATLIGLAVFFSSMAIDDRVSTLLPLTFVTIGMVVVAIARFGERGRRCRIEEHVKTFPNTQALEAYVGRLDPTVGFDQKGVLALSALCLLIITAVGLSQALAYMEQRFMAQVQAEETAKAREQEDAGLAPVLATALAENPVKATPEQGWKNSLGMVFVPVPGTKVLFCVWKTRVRDYKAFAQANSGVDASWKEPAFPDRDWKDSGFRQGSTHPVVNVNWEEANQFCAWLTKQEQASGILGQDQRYRLPTDAEWSVAVGLPDEGSGTPIEKAEKNKNRLLFPWGSGRDALPIPRGIGNYGSTNCDDFEYTSPVCAFKPNIFGLYDLGGNAYEWCEDEVGSVQHVIPGQMERVLRGGAWNDEVWDFTTSYYRKREPPRNRSNDNGFRCVLVLPDQQP